MQLLDKVLTPFFWLFYKVQLLTEDLGHFIRNSTYTPTLCSINNKTYKMELKNICKLELIGKEIKQNRFLFNFNFCEIDFKLIFFIETKSLLISTTSLNVGHIINFSNGTKFNGKLPSNFYYAIRKKIIDYTKEDKIIQLWNSLDNHILKLNNENILEVSEREITDSLINTVTDDKEYDPDGKKPYFYTWARNNIRNVKSENLLKTERYFGKEIMELCKQNNISSKWKETPSKDSLIFLNVEKTKNKITKHNKV